MKNGAAALRADAAMATPMDVAIGAALKEARQLRKFSQQALGRMVGVSQQQIQKYEKGQNRLSATVLINLARALAMQPAELLPHQGAPRDDRRITTLNDDQHELLKGFAEMSPARRRALLELVRAAQL